MQCYEQNGNEYELMICALYINLAVFKATHMPRSPFFPTKPILRCVLRARFQLAMAT